MNPPVSPPSFIYYLFEGAVISFWAFRAPVNLLSSLASKENR